MAAKPQSPAKFADQAAEQFEIAPIVPDRVRRQPPLLGEFVEVGADAGGARAGVIARFQA
jgi:hypothetical protein